MLQIYKQLTADLDDLTTKTIGPGTILKGPYTDLKVLAISLQFGPYMQTWATVVEAEDLATQEIYYYDAADVARWVGGGMTICQEQSFPLS